MCQPGKLILKAALDPFIKNNIKIIGHSNKSITQLYEKSVFNQWKIESPNAK